MEHLHQYLYGNQFNKQRLSSAKKLDYRRHLHEHMDGSFNNC
jgi:hypothetical protein